VERTADGQGAADNAESLAGWESLYRQLPVFRRLAYPIRGEATNRVLLGCKSPGCPAGVRSGRNDLGGEQTWRPEHNEISASSKSGPARSRHSRDRCGKPTHFPVGKADDTVEETGANTRWYRRGRGSSIQGKVLGITSGSCRGQRGLVTTCKDSPNEAKSRRRREPNGSGE
jgi:hypothetical protein